ncbi:MAG: glycosyltransferase, partial [bacterium]
MANRGHEVHIFHHIRSGFLRRPRLVSTVRDGIRYHGLRNSPTSFSEAMAHPLKSWSEKGTEAIFKRLLDRIQPDIVHFHEFERTPSRCIDISADQRIPTLVTLHDYWFVCPRCQLFTLDEHICEGPGDGTHCVSRCLAHGFLTRQYRKMTMLLPDGPVLRVVKRMRNIYKRISGERLGQATSRTGSERRRAGTVNMSQARAFARRRDLTLGSLARSDLILAVSSCVKGVFEGHLIDTNKLVVNQLGVKSAEWVTRRRRCFTFYPVRFGFMGHLGPSKGAHLIIQAAQGIRPGYARFLFFGGADQESLHDFKRDTEGMPFCTYEGRYDYRTLDRVFDRFDVLIIPSLWQETLGMIGLEAQAAGIPIIASDTGGMRDYVTHGRNGLRFPVGDATGLAECIQGILDHPEKIEELSGHAIAPKTIPANCTEIIGYYEKLRNKHPVHADRPCAMSAHP